MGQLFEILTLEGWTDLQATVITAVPMAWLFFTSFIVLAVFVVINNLEATKAADRPRRRTRPPRLRRLPMKQ